MANLDSANVSQDQTHQANHQADTKSSSSSTTSAQNHQSFEATTAVLDTNELLHLIIVEVPRKCRPSIRGVSKTWKAAVTKVGYTLEPSGYAPFYYQSQHFPLPLVSREEAFKINPVFGTTENMLQEASTLRDENGESLECYQRSVPCDDSELLGRRHEFVTNPPVTQVEMTVGWWGPYAEQSAILRVSGGIRIRHLLDYPNKMLPPKRCGYHHLWWSIGRNFGGNLLDRSTLQRSAYRERSGRFRDSRRR